MQSMTIGLEAPKASCSAMRSIQKMSGLFNQEVGSESAGLLLQSADLASPVFEEGAAMTSAESLSSHAVSAFDLLSSLDKFDSGSLLGDSGSLLGAGDGIVMPGAAAADVTEDPVVSMATNSDFLEVFTDLSYLMGDLPMDVDTLLEPPPTSDASPVAEGVTTRKRTASKAFPFDAVTPSTNPDHSDYTSKGQRGRKRSRLTSVAESVGSVSEEGEGVVSTTEPAPPLSKYKERRVKNNIASKRSRETRKQKFVQMEDQTLELERSNAELRVKIEQLEKLTKQMKDTLVQRLVGAK